jgi:prevent-host-death family protein
MDVPVSEAKARLTDLVRRAETGEEIFLTRFGRAVARLTSVRKTLSARDKRSIMDEIRFAGKLEALPGPGSARSQDFLYDEAGLPE